MAVRRTRLVQWIGDSDPERLEAATITLFDDRLTALGTSRTAEYVTSWSLTTGANWITELMDVTVHGSGWSRHLTLRHEPGGRWTSAVDEHGHPDLPAAGLVDADALAGALDCDLALCPMTNTMPILRLGLLTAAVEETQLVMAWIDLPSLRVIRSDQVYSSDGSTDTATGHRIARYQSLRRDFVGDLTVDDDGVVVDYPGLARRV